MRPIDFIILDVITYSCVVLALFAILWLLIIVVKRIVSEIKDKEGE